MERVTRNDPLSPSEAAKYRQLRAQVDSELPELIDRHLHRMESLKRIEDLFPQLKQAREARGLELADLITVQKQRGVEIKDDDVIISPGRALEIRKHFSLASAQNFTSSRKKFAFFHHRTKRSSTSSAPTTTKRISKPRTPRATTFSAVR